MNFGKKTILILLLLSILLFAGCTIKRIGQEASCGNNEINSGEDCTNCPEDVKCDKGRVCQAGACVQDPKIIDKLDLCTKNESIAKRDNCIKSLAKSTNDYTMCSMLTDASVKDCISTVAQAARKPDLCTKVGDDTIYNLCITGIAKATKDYNVCLYLSSTAQDSCIKEIAIMKKDVDVCFVINSQDGRDLCLKDLAIKKKESVICEYILETYDNGGYAKDNCYIGIGINLANCSKLIEKGRTQECIDKAKESSLDKADCEDFGPDYSEACYLKQASIKKDYTICIDFKDDNRKFYETCIDALYAKDKKNAKLCPHIYDSAKKNTCYYDSAMNDSNGLLCLKISDQTKRGECTKKVYTKVALASKVSKPCQSIQDNDDMRDCVISVAKAIGSEFACSILNQSAKEICLTEVAVVKEQTSACFLLSDVLDRDLCVKDVAIKSQNIDLCSQIGKNMSGDYVRDDCYISLEKDMATCLKLIEKERQSECIAKARESSLGNDDCDKFSPASRMQCYYKQSELMQDFRICTKFKDSDREFYDKCMEQAYEKDDGKKDMCQFIEDYEMKNICYFDVANNEIRSNIDICYEISDRDLRSNCIIKVATDLENEKICKVFAKDITRRDDCYKSLAEVKQDIALCSKMYYTVSFASCYANIAYALSQPEICDSMQIFKYPNLQDAITDCYYYYVAKSDDKTYCQNILNLQLRERLKCPNLE